MQDLVYGWEPVVAVFAEDDAGLAEASAIVDSAGARLGARARVDDALDRLDEQSADAVVVRVSASGRGAGLAALLARLNEAAASGRCGSVVMIPPALIDFAMSVAPHPDVALICHGSAIEAVAALALALAARTPLVMEERGDETPGQLRRLREDVGRIAQALARMSGQEAPRRADEPLAAATTPAPPGGEFAAAPLLRAMIRDRRQRDQFFAADLFADPAWDMLLDLMLARCERRLVAVSSLCIAAAVPPTTALRWIKRLTDEGLFIRAADPRDGRRVYIDLSVACAERMAVYLRTLAPPATPLRRDAGGA